MATRLSSAVTPRVTATALALASAATWLCLPPSTRKWRRTRVKQSTGKHCSSDATSVKDAAVRRLDEWAKVRDDRSWALPIPKRGASRCVRHEPFHRRIKLPRFCQPPHIFHPLHVKLPTDAAHRSEQPGLVHQHAACRVCMAANREDERRISERGDGHLNHRTGVSKKGVGNQVLVGLVGGSRLSPLLRREHEAHDRIGCHVVHVNEGRNDGQQRRCQQFVQPLVPQLREVAVDQPHECYRDQRREHHVGQPTWPNPPDGLNRNLVPRLDISYTTFQPHKRCQQHVQQPRIVPLAVVQDPAHGHQDCLGIRTSKAVGAELTVARQ
mmetsp:Transcript_4629/g.14996  ORF Transcript_4629/g.14996 Transcript_4629/m.14996 type:complete len:326 (-) Transcript_4629:417-1394(-)